MYAVRRFSARELESLIASGVPPNAIPASVFRIYERRACPLPMLQNGHSNSLLVSVSEGSGDSDGFNGCEVYVERSDEHTAIFEGGGEPAVAIVLDEGLVGRAVAGEIPSSVPRRSGWCCSRLVSVAPP